MAVPYSIDGKRRYAQAVLSGIVTGQDIARTIEAIYDSPDWRPGFDIIWNFAGVTDLVFDTDDLESLVALRRARADAGGAGRDIIVIKRILDDALARLYAAMTKNERRRTRLCASEDTALEILGLAGDAGP